MLINLLQKNRSYRSYDEAYHVSRATLEELIDCTRYTASSVNMQPLKYFAANEPETVSRIQPLTHWAGKLKELHLPRQGRRYDDMEEAVKAVAAEQFDRFFSPRRTGKDKSRRGVI